MLLGMPCVSADVGGIPSLFRDGTDGILYKGYQGLDEEAELSRIVGELRDAVLALFEDPGQAARYGEAAREHALRTHDPEANYRRVLEIYQEIARGGEA